MKKWLKITLWIVGGLLALLIILSLLAGPIVRGYVNRHGEDLIGRKVEVKHVGVNILAGNVKVRDFAVFEDNGEDIFAGFDTLDVTIHLLKIPFGTLHFSHITLTGLNANIIQNGQRFNFSSIPDHLAKDSSKVENAAQSRWTMKFYNICLRRAELHYSDVVNHKDLNVVDVNLRVPGFVVGGDEDSEGGLNLAFTEGGRLWLDAGYDTKESAFTVKADLKEFAMRNIESYVSDMLRFESLDGTLDAGITAAGHINDVLGSEIAGTVAMHNIAINDVNSQIVGFRDLNVKVSNINLGDNIFDFESITIDGLKARYEQWEGYSNISRLTTIQKKEQPQAITLQTQIDAASAPKEKSKSGKPMQLHVGSFRMNDCAMTYVDHTMPDRFEFPITGLSVSADNLTTNGENNAEVRASLPGGGNMIVRWNGNISNWKEYQNLFLTIKGLDMRQLSPLTVAYTGQPIEDGTFGLVTHTGITNSQLDSKIKLDIYKAKVGSRRNDVDPEYKIPLKTALYILKDKNDKILIDMPITGNIDSPVFNYMKLVWKTLGNLLVKVATSPARALGSAMGFGSDDLEFIAVDTQQYGLTSEQYHILADLATIAKADTMLTYTFEQQFPEPSDDTLVRRYANLNESIRRYMKEQGIVENRVKITVGVPVSPGKTGYAILSELKLGE